MLEDNLFARIWAIGVWGMVLVGTAALLTSGCSGHQHMSPAYGQSAAAVLEAQRVYPSSTSRQPNGLDSEEAAIVHDAYRRSIGKNADDAAAKQSHAKVLLIEDSGKK